MYFETNLNNFALITQLSLVFYPSLWAPIPAGHADLFQTQPASLICIHPEYNYTVHRAYADTSTYTYTYVFLSLGSTMC